MDSTGRDRGLSRISRLTRWSAVGALGMTGVFSVLVARTHPGTPRTPSGPAAPGSGSTATVPSTIASDDTGGSSQLRPPAQVPQPSSGRGAVTSGAS